MGGVLQSLPADAVVRAVSTAAKSLRLYPPTSPAPWKAAEAAVTALQEFFATGEQVLSLAVTRDGFASHGQDVAAGLMGGADLSAELRAHGIAELDFLPGCTPDEMVAFLGVIGEDPAVVRGRGGVSAAVLEAKVESIRVVDVQLTVVERIGPAADEDIDEFLRELARDPQKLAAWFAAASAGDPHTFEEGLLEIARVAGPGGMEDLTRSLAAAFSAQGPEGQDALIGLAVEDGPARNLAGGMFRFLDSGDIAGAVLGGKFGKNMLSLSTALTRLPLEQVTAQVRKEIQAMLPGAGHSDKEARFLEHMIDARERAMPETSLVDADRTYRDVVTATAIPADVVGKARDAVTASKGTLGTASVRTMLTLLDQQKDFDLFCQSADALASMVPRLIEQGELDMAASVLADLSNRAAHPTGPWPELSERLRVSVSAAVGERSMKALVHAVVADAKLMGSARQILRHGGEAAGTALVSEAIGLKAEGIAVAEELVGRRIIDLLAQLAVAAQWFQLRPIVARLARESDHRATAAIEQLLKRTDEQSRREVVAGLADSGGMNAGRLLASALRDPSREVVTVAVRALARSGLPGAANVLGSRLAELDVDNGDFPLAREIITSLAHVPDAAADEALNKLASRKALIKRGHFAEVQELAAEAVALRKRGGGR